MVHKLENISFLNNYNINLICAKDKLNGIGKGGKLLWHIPKDLRWMKLHTINHTVIMGKNTFQDILTHTHNKPLPNRRNIVLSINPNKMWPKHIEIYPSIKSSFENIKKDEVVFVLGGEKIFQLFLPVAKKLFLTEVDSIHDADTFFPFFDEKQYKEVFCQQDSDDKYQFTFKILEKLDIHPL